MSINSTHGTPGRLVNNIIRNIACSIIAKKEDLRMKYAYSDECSVLGIKLFSGNTTYNHPIQVDDSNYFDMIIHGTNRRDILIMDNFYAQTKEYAFYLKTHIRAIQQSIIDYNPFNHRYETNNDLFIHVRLGDLLDIQKNDGRKCYHSLEYYDKICSKLSFDTGYIASDSIDHEICQTLIQKYNLKVYNEHEVTTIQFGSTCKHIVLSPGTFSWIIGVFGFYSNVYYSMKNIDNWHGDIFVFPDWNVVEF